MTARTVWQGLAAPPWRFLFSRWPWLGLGYAATSAIMVTLLLPLVIVTILLLPLWAILFGAMERQRARLLGFAPAPSGHVRIPRAERHNWLNIRLTEPATWRESLAMLAGIVFGIASLVALLAEAMALIVLIGLPIAASQRPSRVTLFGDVWILLGPANWWQPLLAVPLLLAIGAYLNTALAAAQAGCVRWLTAPRAAEIDRRVEQLTRSRAVIVAAHESERRRIERDLHDGVQQELVGIAARLGVLDLELGAGDADAARTALRRAQDQTERALAALRETALGIHPAVLTDHGLVAALQELAGRSAVPLLVDDRGIGRLATAAEAAGYFVVAEAVTNAAKHSVATRVTATLTADAAGAVIAVSDDGGGGADPARGTGLRGLTERAAAIGGSLRIVSPAGGPTVLTLTLPPEIAAAERSDDAAAAR